MDRFLEYIAHHPWLAAAAAAMAALVVAFEMRTRSGNLASVSPQDAVRVMNQGGSLVLDIRQPGDFSAGHLSGARQLPSDQILTAGETLKKYKEKPVLVYCERGAVSAAASRQLAAQGFTKAVHLRGGVAAWRAENLPLVRG